MMRTWFDRVSFVGMDSSDEAARAEQVSDLVMRELEEFAPRDVVPSWPKFPVAKDRGERVHSGNRIVTLDWLK